MSLKFITQFMCITKYKEVIICALIQCAIFMKYYMMLWTWTNSLEQYKNMKMDKRYRT